MNGLAPPNERWQRLSAYFLALTLSLGVLVMFFPGRWINPSLLQVGLFLLSSVWAMAFVCRPFRLHLGAVLIPLGATVGWGLLQLATGITVSRWDTWMAVLGWIGNLAACFLAMHVSLSGRIRRAFLNALLTFAFLLSLVSVVQYFSSEGKIFWFYPSYEAAVLGPFLNRDRYAAFVELLLPLALMRTLGGGRRSLRFAVMGAAMFASVIAGASRAGALLTTAEIIVVPLIAWKKGSFLQDRIGAATARIWLFALVFTAVVGWAVLWARFQDPDPLKGRREMLASTITMIKARPYMGFGLGTFQDVYPKYASVDFGTVVNHAHNDWAEWAADGGIPFSLLLLWIAILCLRKAADSPWGIGIFAVFVHSLVDFPMQGPIPAPWLFALAGALSAETAARR
jgi:O-antigen ligase